MNAPKVTDIDYIQFLIAAQRVYTCTEAVRCAEIASHDAYTRLLFVAENGDTEQKIEYWATSDLKMLDWTRQELARQVFAIENYHRQLKQCCGVERAQVRSIKAQTCHILLSLRAFVRLEAHRLQTGISGYAAKANIIREAIRLYLQKPNIHLETTA